MITNQGVSHVRITRAQLRTAFKIVFKYADNIVMKTSATYNEQHQQKTYIYLMESGLNYVEIEKTPTNDLTNLDMYISDGAYWGKTLSSCFRVTNCTL